MILSGIGKPTKNNRQNFAKDIDMSTERMIQIITFLKVMFSETSSRFVWLENFFSGRPNLSIPDEKQTPDEDAHNAKEDKYLPLVDSRIPNVKLLLRPIYSSKKYIGDIITLQTRKVSWENLEAFANVYASRKVTKSKTFKNLVTLLAARQLNEDIANNGRQALLLKRDEESKIAAFAALSDTEWASAQTAIALVMKDEDFDSLVEEVNARRVTLAETELSA